MSCLLASGLSGSDDVGALVARLDDTQHDLEAGNAALLARNLRIVALLAEDAVTLTGLAQVRAKRSGRGLARSRLCQGHSSSCSPSVPPRLPAQYEAAGHWLAPWSGTLLCSSDVDSVLINV